MRTAINHGRELAEAADQEPVFTPEDVLEAQELARQARHVRQRQHAALYGVEHPEFDEAGQ